MNKNQFHPTVDFVYYMSAVAFSMTLMNPLFLAVSFVSSLICGAFINGGRTLRLNLKYMLPLLIITAVINPAFNHAGVTIITYLPGGNPLTAESIAFGLASAVMIVTVINWFSCFNAVITTDKLMYLFGRVLPSLSLMLSMTLNFVPRFRSRIAEIRAARRTLSKGDAKMRDKIKEGAAVISVMVTWSLEGAAETADSMKCRGYGLKGRTAFSLYKFTRRDFFALAYIAVCAAYILFCAVKGEIHFQYFPYFKYSVNAYVISAAAVYGAMLGTAAAAGAAEEIRWKHTSNLKI